MKDLAWSQIQTSTLFTFSLFQEDVYVATTKNLIDGVIAGYNATVFAYGPTGNVDVTFSVLCLDTNSHNVYSNTLQNSDHPKWKFLAKTENSEPNGMKNETANFNFTDTSPLIGSANYHLPPQIRQYNPLKLSILLSK